MQAQQVYNFEYTGSIVNWTVPAGVTYISIEASGAQGGNNGGKGAKMKGNFTVTPGETLKILVGEKGGDMVINNQGSGGGGGGSFITNATNIPLIVAGGGGGFAQDPSRQLISPIDANGNITENGNDGNSKESYIGGSYSYYHGLGGINGNGATANSDGGNAHAGNGGGFYTNGANGFAGTGGTSFINGGTKVIKQNYADGAFGGGATGGYWGAGGGGGYSGGGGSYHAPSNGGGGGSYNIGTDQVNIAGANTGNGIVVITSLFSATLSETNSIACAGDATGELSATVSGGTAPYTYSWSPAGGTAAVASNLTVGTYIVTVTDAVGNTTTATKEIKANDTEAPVIVKSGTKVLSIPAGENRDGSIYTHYFTDPLPAGTVVTGVTLEYSGRDQGWGGTGAWARMVVSDTQIGSNQFFGYSQNFRIEYKGDIPGYVYGGNNHMKMFYNSGWGWVGYFQGGTMTIHYETLADVKGECTATVTTVPVANDNCAGAVTGTTTDPLTYSTQGTHVITWKFDDGNGNVSTASQNVIIQDINAPTALAKNITVQLDATGAATITPAMVDNGSSDACSDVTLSLSKTAFDCSNVGANTVTLTVTDKNGNKATVDATVTVADNIAPVALAKNITVQL
ncbi:SprB repeat-containing protein, partial [Pontibacter populi]